MTTGKQRDLITRDPPALMVDSIRERLGRAEYGSVSHVAAACNVGVKLVLDGWIQEGHIQAVNCGGKEKPYYRVYLPSVVEFWKRRMVGAEVEAQAAARQARKETRR